MLPDLNALADYLLAERETVLTAWRQAVDEDPQLSTPSRLTRHEFNDHIPAVLEALAATLRRAGSDPGREPVATEADSAHGIHRWQQGYYLTEVLREWSHLMAVLVAEVERFASLHQDADPEALSAARRALADFFCEATTDSVSQYFQLKQVEAQGRFRDLEAALLRLGSLERDRGRLLREASHDLRGSVSVAASATAALRQPAIADADREAMLGALERSLGELRSLLNDLMDLARLEAGQDPRRVHVFDAGELLFGLCDSLRGVAREHRLELTGAGPRPLSVEGDPIKVRRIVQNLLLNALHYSAAGEVHCRWGLRDASRWWIEIEDTGPGLHAASAQPLIEGLDAATQVADGETAAIPQSDGAPVAPARGEGIGLSIVKRLCEALDAGLEVRSDPGRGCQFRVTLPRAYDGTQPGGAPL